MERTNIEIENDEVCAECGFVITQSCDTAVWVNPQNGEATTGVHGKPYHVECATDEGERKNMPQNKILLLDKKIFKDLTDVLDYVIQHERENYRESEGKRERHVYKLATRVYDEMVEQDLF